MRKFTDIKTEMEGASKKLTLNWNPVRLSAFIICGLICLILLFFTISGSANIEFMGKPIDTKSFEGKLAGSAIIALIFAIYLLLFYPLRIIIRKDGSGRMSIEKRDFFFFSKNYTASNAKDSLLVLRKRKRNWRIWFRLKSNYYWPLIKYSENGEFKEVDLVPFILHYTNDGIYETIKKEEAEEICKYLDLKLVVEE